MDYTFTCLHCHEPFIIADKEFNCRILRHGVFKSTLEPIPPHATKEECDALLRSGTIYGCAGPLQIVESSSSAAAAVDGRFTLVICDYI
jgi:hypothetical protein